MSTTPINDGGPAFPFPFLQDGDPSGLKNADGSKGMSLRDWFAGQALAGWAAQPSHNFFFEWRNRASSADVAFLGYGETPDGPGDWHVVKTPYDAMAERMYAYADAMIRARKGTP